MRVIKVSIFLILQILTFLIVIFLQGNYDKQDNVSKLQAFSSETLAFYIKDTIDGIYLGSGNEEFLILIVVYDGEQHDVLITELTSIYLNRRRVDIDTFLNTIKYDDNIFIEYRVVNGTKVALAVYY